MHIHTKYFGDTEYTEDQILRLQEGLFGFENANNYILVRFSENNDTMLYLQSLEDEQLGFLVMNPFHLLKEYAPVLSDQEIQDLEIISQQDVVCYVICVAQQPIDDSTVNLKCPIIFNTVNHQGRQVILDDIRYSFSHALSEFKYKEEAHANPAT